VAAAATCNVSNGTHFARTQTFFLSKWTYLSLLIGRHSSSDTAARTDKETPEEQRNPGDGDQGVGSGRGLKPSSSPRCPLIFSRPSSTRRPLAGHAAEGALPPHPLAAAGEVRVPPRQERGLGRLQVPGPHPRVRRAGQLAFPFFGLLKFFSFCSCGCLLLFHCLSSCCLTVIFGRLFRRQASSGSTWLGG
jgi:hypothetical protein